MLLKRKCISAVLAAQFVLLLFLLSLAGAAGESVPRADKVAGETASVENALFAATDRHAAYETISVARGEKEEKPREGGSSEHAGSPRGNVPSGGEKPSAGKKLPRVSKGNTFCAFRPRENDPMEPGRRERIEALWSPLFFRPAGLFNEKEEQ